MDEEEVWGNFSYSRPEANPGDQYSPDLSSEDSFVTPDSYSSSSSSGRKNIDVSPNLSTNSSSSGRKNIDFSPNLSTNSSSSGRKNVDFSSILSTNSVLSTNSSSSGRKNIDFSPNLSPNSSSSGRKNIDFSPNVDTNSSSSGRKSIDVSPNIDTNSSSSGRKNIDVSQNVDTNGSNKQVEKSDSKAGYIDTAPPFESVREAVSRFGAIADWKAHRVQTIARRKFIEQELEKAQEEIPIYKQRSELAEQEKHQALKKLDSTKRLIQELRLHLERTQTEERQAKQDSELAELRIEELKQGINDESSVAAKTQLEVAKARHQEVAKQLITAKAELEETRKDYEILISERDSAVEKAHEAVSAAKELEAEVENLTIQLITTKESIETIHALHLEVEEHRMHEVNELDLELLNLDHELKQAEDELENVKQQVLLAEDLKAKFEAASELLHKLKYELAVYMQGKKPGEADDENFTREDIHSSVASAKKNLDEVNQKIERTTEEIMSLKTAAKSLTAKLEGERQVLDNIRKQAKFGAESVVNLESEIKRAQSELDNTRRKEKEAREKVMELPLRLQKAKEETENAKLLAEGASLVLKRAKKVVEEAKNEVNSLLSQVAATEKEIEAARAKEKLALGAISALHESESARCMNTEDLKGGVTITLEEYYELSIRAHEAEEAANKRVAEATAEVDEAKESEMQSLVRLTQLNSEIAERKEALNVALQKAEMAKESKSNIEDELNRRNGETQEDDEDLSDKMKHDSRSDDLAASRSMKASGVVEGRSSTDEGKSVKGLFKKRRSFMPKISLAFMGKKKHSWNKNS